MLLFTTLPPVEPPLTVTLPPDWWWPSTLGLEEGQEDPWWWLIAIDLEKDPPTDYGNEDSDDFFEESPLDWRPDWRCCSDPDSLPFEDDSFVPEDED